MISNRSFSAPQRDVLGLRHLAKTQWVSRKDAKSAERIYREYVAALTGPLAILARLDYGRNTW